MSNPFKRFRQLESSAYADESLYQSPSKTPRENISTDAEDAQPQRKRDLKAIEQSYRQNQHYDRLNTVRTQLAPQTPDAAVPDQVKVFELGNKRRVQVKQYQGQVFVDIREYF